MKPISLLPRTRVIRSGCYRQWASRSPWCRFTPTTKGSVCLIFWSVCARVRAAASAGIEVRVIPGPSAITAALAVAGLPTSRFCFEGFLPSRARERRTELARLARETRTLVFFEAPHRIAETLADLVSEFGGERRAVVARELTKTHETIYRGTLSELAQQAANDTNFQRGEITLVVSGAEEAAASTVDLQLLKRAVELLAKELPPGRAASIAAQLTGASRSEAYELLKDRET